MQARQKAGWMFAIWAIAVVVMGAALMSLHQPFRSPGSSVLLLAGEGGNGQWRAIHLLSGSCGCSQRVLLNLLSEGPIAGVQEQVLVVDDHSPYLPGSMEILARLEQSGRQVRHLRVDELPAEVGLNGVPLLVLASPDDRIAYAGGYGPQGDQEPALLREVRSGTTPQPLPLVGCAVGLRLKQRADPFHLKN